MSIKNTDYSKTLNKRRRTTINLCAIGLTSEIEEAYLRGIRSTGRPSLRAKEKAVRFLS